MKTIKKLGLLTGLCSVGFLLVGCGTTPTTSSSPTAQATSGADIMQNRRPERAIDIQGTVKSLVGNEVTVNAIDTSSNPLLALSMQEMRQKMQELPEEKRQAFMQEMQSARENAKTYEVTVLVPAGIPIAVRNFGGGNRPGGQGMPGMGQRPGGQSASQGLAGVFGNNGNGSGNRQAMPQLAATGTIDDIKVGNSLSVWLMTGSADRKIAEWVMVSAGAQGGGMGGFGGGPGGGGGQRGQEGGRPPM